jgi:hypothetical protein
VLFEQLTKALSTAEVDKEFKEKSLALLTWWSPRRKALRLS